MGITRRLAANRSQGHDDARHAVFRDMVGNLGQAVDAGAVSLVHVAVDTGLTHRLMAAEIAPVLGYDLQCGSNRLSEAYLNCG
jgi:hypothetical protein